MKALGRAHSFINDCMKEMYRVPTAMFDREVLRFIYLNNELLGKQFPGFRYRGDQYGKFDVGTRSPQLHKSLEDAFIVVLVENQDSKEDMVSIKHFLINTVNSTKSVDDLYELIPHGLNQFIEGYSVLLLSPPVRLDEENMDHLKELSQDVVKKIGEVLALNMLI